MFNKTFFHFLFGFVAIISLAFIVMVGASYQNNSVDNVAAPR